MPANCALDQSNGGKLENEDFTEGDLARALAAARFGRREEAQAWRGRAELCRRSLSFAWQRRALFAGRWASRTMGACMGAIAWMLLSREIDGAVWQVALAAVFALYTAVGSMMMGKWMVGDSAEVGFKERVGALPEWFPKAWMAVAPALLSACGARASPEDAMLIAALACGALACAGVLSRADRQVADWKLAAGKNVAEAFERAGEAWKACDWALSARGKDYALMDHSDMEKARIEAEARQPAHPRRPSARL